MASVATAAALYSQSQAQSFLQLNADVLSAVAPSVDPMNKLAARVSLTFSTPSKGPLADTNSALRTAMGSVVYAVISAQTVAFFQAYSKDERNLATLVATWAKVPESDVLVVPTGDATPLYNVTVWPVGSLLSQLTSGCSDCICSVQNQPMFAPYAWLPSNTSCASQFISSSVGLRYVVDIFSNYDVANSAVVDNLAMQWLALPNSTLQHTRPVVEGVPGSLDPLATALASLGVSIAMLAVGAVLWYRQPAE